MSSESSASVSEDSNATFSAINKTLIRERYQNRCAICLLELTEEGSQCVESARVSQRQIDAAVKLGVLRSGYNPVSAENGIVQCPTCYLGFFADNHIMLAPALELLKYIAQYLLVTPAADRKPLHQVFSLLRDAVDGYTVDLPDPTHILPFLGLYSLVILRPDDMGTPRLLTPHLPEPSILHRRAFIPAPPDTSPTSPGVARIFDVLGLANSTVSDVYGRIPLSPMYPDFLEKRYWRLPVNLGAVLTMLMEHVAGVTLDCEEIKQAQTILGVLRSQSMGGGHGSSAERPGGSGDS